ncbi:MAG: serine hydrolase [Gammaproteobacteria bacterium]|nr:serine hydrolase [Gammaproteobacteria bacterium]
MASRLRRSLWFIVVVALIVALAIVGRLLSQLLGIASAHSAKTLCSAVFVSGRTPASVMADELGPEVHPLLAYVDTTIDNVARTVHAKLFGIIERTAMFRDRYGCTVVYNNMRALKPLPALAARRVTAWPQGEGTDATQSDHRLDAVLDRAFADPDPTLRRRTRAVVIVHKGRIIAERYVPGFNKDTPMVGWSMSKSVMNALVGMLVGQGKLALNAPASVPEWQAPKDPRRQITLDHLLRMSSGLRFVENYADPLKDVTFMLLAAPDMAAYAANKPLDFPPGTHWQYSSGSSSIIARIIRTAAGENDYLEFPRRELFEPLGMSTAVIELDAAGNFVGSASVYASARDWARFGLLYLNNGKWAGRQLLPPDWVTYTRTLTPVLPNGKYGAHFWLRLPEEYVGPTTNTAAIPPDAFHAVGHEGQFVSIIPSRELVIVRLGLTRLPAQWDHAAFISDVLASLR